MLGAAAAPAPPPRQRPPPPPRRAAAQRQPRAPHPPRRSTRSRGTWLPERSADEPAEPLVLPLPLASRASVLLRPLWCWPLTARKSAPTVLAGPATLLAPCNLWGENAVWLEW